MTSLIYPITNFKAVEQLKIDHGDGVYIFDDKGNKYLEGMAGLWCTSLGFGNQELIDTCTTAMGKLSYNHTFSGRTHQSCIDLSDKLAGMVPTVDAHIFLGLSGSDANDTHMKLLRYYFNAIGKPEKRKIITRERGYHGVSVAAGSLTSIPANLAHFDAPIEALGILRTDHPHYYRGRQGDETETEFVDRIIGNLESQILREGPETIAAFIAEPITGAGGVIVPPDGYYQKLQVVLRKFDIFFWSDEVITGFGRTGEDFGATSMGIDSPDMMTFAKQLSSAYYPISAAVIRGDMYEAMVEQSAAVGVFGHGYTYSGHPVGCAVALKTLEIYERDDIFAVAARTGEYFQRRLREFETHDLVGEVRGKGLIAAVELVANKETGQPFSPVVATYLQQACLESGLIGRPLCGTCLAFCPPLIITEAQVDELIEKLGQGLDLTLEFVKKEGMLEAA